MRGRNLKRKPRISKEITLKDYLYHIEVTLINRKVELNRYRRTQETVKFTDLFPHITDQRCRCGCGRTVLPPKICWATRQCNYKATMTYLFLHGDNSTMRKMLKERDRQVCAVCREVSIEWDADHILPVREGGGGCVDLTNLQTLCKKCHKEKHKKKTKTFKK